MTDKNLAQKIIEETGWKPERLAKIANVTSRTAYRWLSGESKIETTAQRVLELVLILEKNGFGEIVDAVTTQRWLAGSRLSTEALDRWSGEKPMSDALADVIGLLRHCSDQLSGARLESGVKELGTARQKVFEAIAWTKEGREVIAKEIDEGES